MTTIERIGQHECNILSDLARSVREVGEMVLREEERREVREWVGGVTVRGMGEFFGDLGGFEEGEGD